MPPSDPLAASRTSRFRVGLGAAVVLLLLGVGVAVLVSALSSSAGSRTIVGAASGEPRARTAAPGASPASGAASGPVQAAAIYVHILGAVAVPGLYQFRDGDRAIDAVAAAGGYTDDADRRQLNLARFLSDGEQIYVPTVDETAKGGGMPGGGASGGSARGTPGGKVNLNVADASALETLPRVGPSLAARILAWRDANGRFTSIEDLMSVSGIGDKTFAGLRDLVTI